MTLEEFQAIPSGLYQVIWVTGARSYAAVSNINPGSNPAMLVCSLSGPIGEATELWKNISEMRPIAPCDSPKECSQRESLVRLGKLRLKDPIKPEIAAIVRDLFLAGEDVDAIAVLAEELNLVPDPSRGRAPAGLGYRALGPAVGERKVLMAGHTKDLYVKEGSNARCGMIQNGVAFRFDGEFGWVIDVEDLIRIVDGYRPLDAYGSVAVCPGCNGAGSIGYFGETCLQCNGYGFPPQA